MVASKPQTQADHVRMSLDLCFYCCFFSLSDDPVKDQMRVKRLDLLIKDK